ncbi:MAG: 30S ribosomal protein S4 [Promethearchaeota archaeon]
MGSPRRLRKKYNTPNNPFEKTRILEEFSYVGKYGLRNKKEFWKHKYQLSHFRKLARESRALPKEQEKMHFNELKSSLLKIGLVGEEANADDVLSLTIENILERRLQTYVLKAGLAKTITQARQFVVHGHIAVRGQVIDSPSYLVKRKDESDITYAVNSPFYNDTSKIWGSGKSAPKDEMEA